MTENKMNKRIPTIFFAFLLTFMFIALASASLQITGKTTSLSIFQGDEDKGSFTLNSSTNLTGIHFNVSNKPSGVTVSFSPSSTDLTENVPKKIDFTVKVGNNVNDNTYDLTINILDSSESIIDSFPLELEVKESLFTMDVDVDDDFDVGETINIDVEIDTDDDIDFTITAEIVGEDADVDLDESLDDDKETYTLELKIPSDLDKGHYDLRITVEAENQDDETQTREKTFSIELHKDKNALNIEKLTLSNTPVCGGPLDLSIRVANAGTRDQDDTTVTIYNQALGINLEKVQNIDENEDETFYFTTTLPVVAPGRYVLEIEASSDYTSTSEFIELNLQTNCIEQKEDVSILALQQNAANIGQDTIFKITLTNNGNTQKTYSIAAQNYQTWATLTGLSPTQVTIAPGQSQDITITLNPLSSASSLNIFQVKVTFGTETKTQDVYVRIGTEEKSNSTLFSSLSNNAWLLIINVVLVLIVIGLIILVATKPRKKQPAEEPKEARLKKVKRK